MAEKNILADVDNFFPLKIAKAFKNDPHASKALALISQQLTDDLFNFIEPAFIDFKFIVVKKFDDAPILPPDKGVGIKMNKAILGQKSKDVIIQVFDDKNVVLWEDLDYSSIFGHADALIYSFEKNKEYFIAAGETIEVTDKNFGSRFSAEFFELELQLGNYGIHKIKNSSCPLFDRSWTTPKKIFFVGGGKDIPEKYMQESLKNFIQDLSIFKGEVGQFEPTREHNVDGSKPVDIIVRWEKSNRVALVEIKWLGKSMHAGAITSTHTNSRANEGYVQLKDYYEKAKKDYPNKIIKCFLVVIDGRRWQTSDSTVSLKPEDGFYYQHKDLEIDDDKKYYEHFKSMAKPIRMFAEPICP